jgi:uncharacterized repeat protein (TIGR01451 family)
MFKGKGNFIGLAAILACSLGSQAFAVEGCIVVKSVAEVEQKSVDAQGKTTTKLVPLTTAVPGTEVIYTTTAVSKCNAPADKVSISNFVPPHMTFVANSSFSPGADVAYSLDGKAFAAADQLTVQDNGASRKARPDEIKHLRWTLQAPLQPGASAFARFRAVLN